MKMGKFHKVFRFFGKFFGENHTMHAPSWHQFSIQHLYAQAHRKKKTERELCVDTQTHKYSHFYLSTYFVNNLNDDFLCVSFT